MPASAMSSAPAGSEIFIEERELAQAVKALNAAAMFGDDCELTFMLDPETHRPQVRIIDKKSNEVLRHIPPEYALRMAEYLQFENT